jgi:hypothetical protein
MTVMAIILNWNGKDVPEKLKSLPAGRYVLQDVHPTLDLDSEQQDGLERALDSLESGAGLGDIEVLKALRSRLDD